MASDVVRAGKRLLEMALRCSGEQMRTQQEKDKPSADRTREPIPVQDQRELCYDSLGVCGKPNCGHDLNIRTAMSGALTTVGEMAHIVAAQDNGPRGNSSFQGSQRERYENLILLCPICHKEVDNPANFAAYPATMLKEWKDRLRAQRRAAVARSREHPKISELGQLLDGLATATPVFDDSFERVNLRKKIEVNGLSAAVDSTISRNIIHVPMVSRQIELVERIRPNYGEMIKTRMATEWLILSDQAIEGDAAYAALKDMLMFRCGQVGSEGVVDIVLSYFFERCTILNRE